MWRSFGPCIVLLMWFCPPVSSSAWNYDSRGPIGPEHWEDPACKLKQQSPIDIVDSAVRYDPNLTMSLINYDKVLASTKWKLKNNGHAVQVDIGYNGSEYGKQYRVLFRGDEYAALQFHFHWGHTDERGSEHLRNGRYYLGEIHIVHYNLKYAFEEKLNHSDGLLVLGTFVKKGDINPELKKLTDKFPKIAYEEKEIFVDPFPLEGLIGVNAVQEFMHYAGSLTTPPCSEVVTWLLAKNDITMDESQFAAFRSLHAEKEDSNNVTLLSGNDRPAQPLNHRVVLSSFKPTSDASLARPSYIASFLLIPGALFIVSRL